MKRIFWLNGNFLFSNEINIESFNNIHSNSGAFENVCFYNGKIFQFEKHIERLFYSAKTLFMNIQFSFENIFQACTKLIETDQIKDGYISLKIFLSQEKNDINIAIFCLPRINHYTEKVTDKKPLSLEISPITKPTIESSVYQSKISSLQPINHIAKQNASNNGYDDALILNHRGFITQATSSNFFIVKDENLYTSLPESCLNGITRQTIIEIAQTNNIQVIEKDINHEELFKADEVFLTDTTDEINPILSINGHHFQDNPTTKLLYFKFYQLTQG